MSLFGLLGLLRVVFVWNCCTRFKKFVWCSICKLFRQQQPAGPAAHLQPFEERLLPATFVCQQTIFDIVASKASKQAALLKLLLLLYTAQYVTFALAALATTNEMENTTTVLYYYINVKKCTVCTLDKLDHRKTKAGCIMSPSDALWCKPMLHGSF